MNLDFHTAVSAEIPRVIVFTVDDNGDQDKVIAEFPLSHSSVSEAENAALAFIAAATESESL